VKKILIDTCVWSLALRGKNTRNKEIAAELSSIIDQGSVIIIGPVRQELLSGYSNENQYLNLKQKLDYFPNHKILDNDYILAAEYSNSCRVKGIQGSHTDFLICSVATRLKSSIFTTDKDFQHYKLHLPIKLHSF
jgi:predicted nucleic acid-binding protein